MKTEAELNAEADEAERQGHALIDLSAILRQAAQLRRRIDTGDSPAPSSRTYNRIVALNMTQANACEAAIKGLGKPSSLEEIAQFILDKGLPVKTTEAKNYGPVMSRDKRFTSHGMNKWGLAEANLSSVQKAVKEAFPVPDDSEEQEHPNGDGTRKPPMQFFPSHPVEPKTYGGDT